MSSTESSSRAEGDQESRRARDAGAGTVLTGVAMLVLLAATLVGLWIASWIDAVHQARHAADLAALAGAGARAGGRDPCTAAERMARANRGTLLACVDTGSVQSFQLRVRVGVPLTPRAPGGPRVVGADAVAGAGMR